MYNKVRKLKFSRFSFQNKPLLVIDRSLKQYYENYWTTVSCSRCKLPKPTGTDFTNHFVAIFDCFTFVCDYYEQHVFGTSQKCQLGVFVYSERLRFALLSFVCSVLFFFITLTQMQKEARTHNKQMKMEQTRSRSE